jgi:hypothetical protein
MRWKTSKRTCWGRQLGGVRRRWRYAPAGEDVRTCLLHLASWPRGRDSQPSPVLPENLNLLLFSTLLVLAYILSTARSTYVAGSESLKALRCRGMHPAPRAG